MKSKNNIVLTTYYLSFNIKGYSVYAINVINKSTYAITAKIY